MPRPLRILYENAFYHVFNRGVEKRPIFNDDEDRQRFIHLLLETLRKFGTKLLAYCLMNNHYHLSLQTTQANLDRFMHRLSSCYVRYLNKKYNRVGPLFQGRYRDVLIQDDKHLLTVIRYIHLNVLDHSHYSLENYPWSSYSRFLQVSNQESDELIEIEWVLGLFDTNRLVAIKSFKSFHQAAVQPVPGTCLAPVF